MAYEETKPEASTPPGPNAESVNVWRKRIKIAQEVRDKEKQIWDKNLLSYRGKLKPDERIWCPEDPWVSVELVHSSIRASIPSLLYSNPGWTVYPRKPMIEMGPGGEMIDMSWENARSKELWLDSVWRETRGNEHVRVAMISAFLAFGAVKVGYSPDFEDCDTRGEYAYDDNGDLIPTGDTDEDGNELYKLEQGDYLRDEEGEPYYDDDTGLHVLDPGLLQREHFFVEWVPWDNLLFDPEGGNNFKNHRYVIEEWCRPLDHVRYDPRYNPRLRLQVRAATSVRQELFRAGESSSPDGAQEPLDVEAAANVDEERVRGWDIYDFEERRMMVLVEETPGSRVNDEYLLDTSIPEGVEHGPFCFLKWNEDPGRWYPKTDAEAMAKIELEYNLTRSQMLTHRNQSRGRYLETMNGGFAGEDGGELERQKFVSGPSGTVVKVKSPDGITPARKDALSGDFFQSIPNIRLDFAEVAGQPGEARGVADADTATQASLLAANADVRNNDRRDNLTQQFLIDIGTKLLQSAQAHASQVQWIKVAQKPDDPHPFEFKEVTPEDLDGEFDCGVVMGSTQPRNSAARVQLYERIILMIAQNPHIAASPTLMRRMFEAIDLKDEQLISEITNIGQQALAAMGVTPAPGPGGAPGMAATDPNQVIGQIANQYLGARGLPTTSEPNAAAGIPTGARMN